MHVENLMMEQRLLRFTERFFPVRWRVFVDCPSLPNPKGLKTRGPFDKGFDKGCDKGCDKETLFSLEGQRERGVFSETVTRMSRARHAIVPRACHNARTR